jgi:hypothetical protein
LSQPHCFRPFSLLDYDTRYRVNFEPLKVRRIENPCSGDRHVRANWWHLHSLAKPLAGGFGISLCYRENANNLEHEVAALMGFVSTIEKLLLSGANFSQP